jgi:hypothetical protein
VGVRRRGRSRLLEGDGGLDVRLADLVGDEEGGQTGEQAGQEPADQQCACVHEISG